MTGEGIYYAVATGLAAGRAAAESLHAGAPDRAGARYATATRALIGRNLKHTAVGAWLCRRDRLLDAGIRAAAADARAFDDLVELGLANGRITPTLALGIARELARGTRSRAASTVHDTEERPSCES